MFNLTKSLMLGFFKYLRDNKKGALKPFPLAYRISFPPNPLKLVEHQILSQERKNKSIVLHFSDYKVGESEILVQNKRRVRVGT